VARGLTNKLAAICGSQHVLPHRDALATYRSDGLGQYRQTPLAAVLPGCYAYLPGRRDQLQQSDRLASELATWPFPASANWADPI
jgi:hypothetical protein